MMRIESLIDSSFLYAMYNERETHHQQGADFLLSQKISPIIPDVVVSEVMFLLNRSGGQRAAVAFLVAFEQTRPRLEPLQLIDLRRIGEIMLLYPEARLDFVDCCLMALAERLDIRHVCTFDRRDFSIFRPVHVDYLELLP